MAGALQQRDVALDEPPSSSRRSRRQQGAGESPTRLASSWFEMRASRLQLIENAAVESIEGPRHDSFLGRIGKDIANSGKMQQ